MSQPFSPPELQGATPPNSWLGGRGGILTLLPSGNRARIRRTMSLMDAVKSGQIPNPLAKHVKRMLGLGNGENPDAPVQGKKELKLDELETEALEQMLQLIDNECVAIFMEPRLELVPEGEDARFWKPEDPGAMSIAEVSMEDRMFAFQFAQGGSADLDRFRQSQQALATMANEQGVSPTTIEAAARAGRMDGVVPG